MAWRSIISFRSSFLRGPILAWQRTAWPTTKLKGHGASEDLFHCEFVELGVYKLHHSHNIATPPLWTQNDLEKTMHRVPICLQFAQCVGHLVLANHTAWHNSHLNLNAKTNSLVLTTKSLNFIGRLGPHALLSPSLFYIVFLHWNIQVGSSHNSVGHWPEGASAVSAVASCAGAFSPGKGLLGPLPSWNGMGHLKICFTSGQLLVCGTQDETWRNKLIFHSLPALSAVAALPNH